MNLCADCANACGGCSWTALDPATNKPMFKPVDGWDAEYVERDYHLIDSWSYDIVSCPQFVPDPPRKVVELPHISKAVTHDEQDQLIKALAMDAAAEQARLAEKKERMSKKKKERRYESGLCIRCGIRQRREGKTECAECAERAAKRKARKKVIEGAY